MKLRREVDRDTFEAAVRQHEEDEERRAEERKMQREADANKKRAHAARDNKNAAPAASVRCIRCKKWKAQDCYEDTRFHHDNKKRRNDRKMVCFECAKVIMHSIVQSILCC